MYYLIFFNENQEKLCKRGSKSVDVLITYFCTIQFNAILTSTLRIPKWRLPFWVSD
jgi:hypothetical protein